MPEDNNLTIKKTAAKEVFLHFLAIFTLYGSAVSFLTLLFQYINFLVPDPLSPEIGYARSYLGPLRLAISTLIVVYPVFIIVSWFLNRSYFQDSQKRELRLRKWLIYFTLFAAAIIIIGDLVKVVYTFLGGEVTWRFILKAFSVLLVAGLVFGYYLNEVRRIEHSKKVKRFVWAVSIIVGLALIGGFFIVGSPKEERLYRFDEQRVFDLQNIQSQIINYWQRKERLPELLDILKDPISGYQIPADPQTGAAYGYTVKGNLTFELCAVFNRPTPKTPSQNSKTGMAIPIRSPFGAYDPNQSWEHNEGTACFERTIDKELYTPFEKALK